MQYLVRIKLYFPQGAPDLGLPDPPEDSESTKGGTRRRDALLAGDASPLAFLFAWGKGGDFFVLGRGGKLNVSPCTVGGA